MMTQQKQQASTSILFPWQGKLLGGFLVGFVLFLAHSLLLRVSPALSAWYLDNLLIHILWGIPLTFLFLLFILTHLLTHLWRTMKWEYWRTKLPGILLGILTLFLLAISLGGGLWLTFWWENRFPWLVVLHGVAAPLGLLAFLFHRAVAEEPFPLPIFDRVSRGWRGYVTCSVFLLFFILAFAFLPQDRINVTVPPLDVAPAIGTFPPPRSPFYPSDAETTTGHLIPAVELMKDEYCGRCHEDIYKAMACICPLLLLP